MATDADSLEVMFVDDDPAVLDGIRRLLRRQQPGWKASFHTDPIEAVLAYKAAMDHIDAVVCDINMPRINGLQLLQAVHEHTPGVVRIALSGQLDIRSMLGAGKHADCHICKPVNIEVLCTTIVERWRQRTAAHSPDRNGP